MKIGNISIPIKQLIVQYLEQVELKLIAPYIKSGYKIVRRRKRKLKTVYGEIELSYRELRCGKDVVKPLIERMGLEKWQRVDSNLKSQAVSIALDHTYRETSKILEGFDIKLSHQSVSMYVQEEKVIEEEIDVYTQEAKKVYVEVDRFYQSVRKEKKVEKMGVKLGIVYEGKANNMTLRKTYVVGNKFKERLEGEILSRLSEEGEIYFQSDQGERWEIEIPYNHRSFCGYHLKRAGIKDKRIEIWKRYKGLMGAIESNVRVIKKRYRGTVWDVEKFMHHIELRAQKLNGRGVYRAKYEDVEMGIVELLNVKEVASKVLIDTRDVEGKEIRDRINQMFTKKQYSIMSWYG